MAVEGLDAAERLDDRQGFHQVFAGELDQADAPPEILDGQAGEVGRRPARREDVSYNFV